MWGDAEVGARALLLSVRVLSSKVLPRNLTLFLSLPYYMTAVDPPLPLRELRSNLAREAQPSWLQGSVTNSCTQLLCLPVSARFSWCA